MSRRRPAAVTLAGIPDSRHRARARGKTFTISVTGDQHGGTRAVDSLSPRLDDRLERRPQEKPSPVSAGAQSRLPARRGAGTFLTLVAGKTSGSATLDRYRHGGNRRRHVENGPVPRAEVARLGVARGRLFAAAAVRDDSIFASLFAFHGYLLRGGHENRRPGHGRRAHATGRAQGGEGRFMHARCREVTGFRSAIPPPRFLPSGRDAAARRNRSLGRSRTTRAAGVFRSGSPSSGGEWMSRDRGALDRQRPVRFYKTSGDGHHGRPGVLRRRRCQGSGGPTGLRMVTGAGGGSAQKTVTSDSGGFRGGRPGARRLYRAPRRRRARRRVPADPRGLPRASAIPPRKGPRRPQLPSNSLVVLTTLLRIQQRGWRAPARTAARGRGELERYGTPSSRVSRRFRAPPASRALGCTADPTRSRRWRSGNRAPLRRASNTTLGPQLGMCDSRAPTGAVRRRRSGGRDSQHSTLIRTWEPFRRTGQHETFCARPPPVASLYVGLRQNGRRSASSYRHARPRTTIARADFSRGRGRPGLQTPPGTRNGVSNDVGGWRSPPCKESQRLWCTIDGMFWRAHCSSTEAPLPGQKGSRKVGLVRSDSSQAGWGVDDGHARLIHGGTPRRVSKPHSETTGVPDRLPAAHNSGGREGRIQEQRRQTDLGDHQLAARTSTIHLFSKNFGFLWKTKGQERAWRAAMWTESTKTGTTL